MSSSMHRVVTKDYAENLCGGVMICGINFGYSDKDEAQENAGVFTESEPLSFFSDSAVNNTRFRKKVLNWLTGWGFEFVSQAGQEGVFERTFFQTNWLDTQTKSVDSNEPINHKLLVSESDGFLNLLECRKPSVVLFFGSMLIEVLNDIALRDRVVSILGQRSGNAEVFRAELPGYTGIQFKLLVQKFGETQIIGLPHPQARGVSDKYMAALKPPAHIFQRIIDMKTLV